MSRERSRAPTRQGISKRFIVRLAMTEWPSVRVRGARSKRRERLETAYTERTRTVRTEPTNPQHEHRSHSGHPPFFFFLSFSLSVHFPFTILRFYDSFLSFQVCEQVSFQQSRAIRVTIPLGFAFVHPFVARIPIYIPVHFSRLAIEKFARFHVKT